MPKPKAGAAVKRGEVFSTCLEEMIVMCNELRARRKFCEQAGEFLKSKGLLEEFEAFRTDLNKGSPSE